MQGEEAGLRAPGPAHAPGGLHQQDGAGVGVNLQGATQQRRQIFRLDLKDALIQGDGK